MKLTAAEALLKIDVDKGSKRLPRRVMDWRMKRAGFRIVQLRVRRSPSGAGWHLVARVAPRPSSPQTVVALQLLLGSDPMREACNLRRANMLKGMPTWARQHWNVLYVKPKEALCSDVK